MTYVTVFYHRGLTHGAVKLRPWMRKFVIRSGSWVTGLDPKTWCCMHRMHHLHSDTKYDPHSPLTYGVFGLFLAQLHSYTRTMSRLIMEDRRYMAMVPDLDFPVHWLNRRKLELVPYLVHAALAIAVSWYFDAWLLGFSYFVGIMSHPIQGWMVNSLAHKYGYRNFSTNDNSKNNTLVAWLAMGEGFQNNHHHRPTSANFSVKWWELDLGFTLCRITRALRMIDMSAKPI